MNDNSLLSSGWLAAPTDRPARLELRPDAGPGNRLLARLGQNEQIIRAYNRSTQAVDQSRRHAAEWLLDNFYLVEEQIQMARRHLPRGYSLSCPPSVGPFRRASARTWLEHRLAEQGTSIEQLVRIESQNIEQHAWDGQ